LQAADGDPWFSFVDRRGGLFGLTIGQAAYRRASEAGGARHGQLVAGAFFRMAEYRAWADRRGMRSSIDVEGS
jgi:hypothetical protein